MLLGRVGEDRLTCSSFLLPGSRAPALQRAWRVINKSPDKYAAGLWLNKPRSCCKLNGQHKAIEICDTGKTQAIYAGGPLHECPGHRWTWDTPETQDYLYQTENLLRGLLSYAIYLFICPVLRSQDTHACMHTTLAFTYAYVHRYTHTYTHTFFLSSQNARSETARVEGSMILT